jgi:hypothetical protein
LSERVPLGTNRARLAWIALTSLVLAGEVFAIEAAVRAFAAAPLFTRGAVCVALLMPAGLLLGFGFPTGMRLAAATGARHTAWFWGINGAAGVTGGAVAVALGISQGLDTTMLAGAACYALLAVPSCMGLKGEKT